MVVGISWQPGSWSAGQENDVAFMKSKCLLLLFNPLNAELNPNCPLLALFGADHILHVSR